MKISILCSDASHPVNQYLIEWADEHSATHKIELARTKKELTAGDILFLVSCKEVLTKNECQAYAVTLVLHASDLPKGRGWSPHIWDLAGGATHITLSLLEAEDRVDSGAIWKKVRINIPATALWDEINHLLFSAEIQLLDYALESYGRITPEEQTSDIEPTYFRMRTPKDSRIDAGKTIAEQFDLIRVCDPNRFPAFFEHRGQKYALQLERLNDD
jgi:methionyl-tRNA formyltransferase